MSIEIARALEALAEVIAKLRFIEAELQSARQLDLKRQREQANKAPLSADPHKGNDAA